MTDKGNGSGVFEEGGGRLLTSEEFDGIWTSGMLIGVTKESNVLAVGGLESTSERTKGSLKLVVP